MKEVAASRGKQLDALLLLYDLSGARETLRPGTTSSASPNSHDVDAPGLL